MWPLAILRTSRPILRDDGERPPSRWGSYASFSCNAYVQVHTHSEDELLDLSRQPKGRQPGLSATYEYMTQLDTTIEIPRKRGNIGGGAISWCIHGR